VAEPFDADEAGAIKKARPVGQGPCKILQATSENKTSTHSGWQGHNDGS
jgi:hypothetical protein